jgi:hypothetical protein
MTLRRSKLAARIIAPASEWQFWLTGLSIEFIETSQFVAIKNKRTYQCIA